MVAEDPKPRFAEEVLTFCDPDGLKLELIAHSGSDRGEAWSAGPVPPESGIRGFHSVTLTVREIQATAELLSETMGLQATLERDNRFRFESVGDAIGSRVDVLHAPDTGFGTVAAGTVRHVAWRVPDESSQEAWRGALGSVGLQPTRVLDRQYFKSIYFREPGGVLFEFATDPPGFTRDESPADLGAGLKLPPWLEAEREKIESALPVIVPPLPTAPGLLSCSCTDEVRLPRAFSSWRTTSIGTTSPTPLPRRRASPGIRRAFWRLSSARVLERMGAAVSLNRYPGMAHTINAEEIEAARVMLDEIAGSRVGADMSAGLPL